MASFSHLLNEKFQRKGEVFFHTIKIDKRFDCNFHSYFVNPQFCPKTLSYQIQQWLQYYKIFRQLLLSQCFFVLSPSIFPFATSSLHHPTVRRHKVKVARSQIWSETFINFTFLFPNVRMTNLQKIEQVIDWKSIDRNGIKGWFGQKSSVRIPITPLPHNVITQHTASSEYLQTFSLFRFTIHKHESRE